MKNEFAIWEVVEDSANDALCVALNFSGKRHLKEFNSAAESKKTDRIRKAAVKEIVRLVKGGEPKDGKYDKETT